MKHILFAALMVGALTCSCSSTIDSNTSEQPEQPVTDGNTTFRFSTSAISVNATSRSTEDSYVSEQGTESEWKVNTVRIYLFDTATKQFAKTILLQNLTRTNTGQQGYVTYTSDRINLSQGTYDVFAVANTNDIINATDEETFISHVDDQTYKIGQIVDTSNGILMTNRAPANLNTTINSYSNSNADNIVDITLERVVARLDVARSAQSYSMRNEAGDVYATVSLADFHYVNLPKSFYTFRHTAVLTSMTAPEWNINSNFGDVADVNGYVIDPYFFHKTIDASTFTNQDAYYVNFYGNYMKGDNVKWTAFKAAATTPAYNTCYSLENCMMQAAQKNGYTTGVVFRGELTPYNNIYKLNESNELERVLAGENISVELQVLRLCACAEYRQRSLPRRAEDLHRRRAAGVWGKTDKLQYGCI